MDQALITTEQLTALRRYDSPTISNAIERCKVRDPVTGYANLELGCQFPEYEPLVGYAVTCTAAGTDAGDTRPNGVVDVLDAVYAAPKPAVLVIQYVGSDRLRSCYAGEIFCTMLQRLGVAGIVTDGGYRDRVGVAERAPGFQIFSPGLVVSHGRNTFFDVNVTVSVCGLTIQPGDLLHGDENGLLQIPIDVVEQVLEYAAGVADGEAAMLDFLQGDDFTYEALRQRM